MQYKEYESSFNHLKSHLLHVIKDYREKHLSISEETRRFVEGIQLHIIEEQSAHEMISTLKELMDSHLPKSFWSKTTELGVFAKTISPIIEAISPETLLKVDLLRKEKAANDKKIHIESLENAIEVLADLQDRALPEAEPDLTVQIEQVQTLYAQNQALMERLQELSTVNEHLQKANEELAKNNITLSTSLSQKQIEYVDLKNDVGWIKQQALQQAHRDSEIKNLRDKVAENERQIQSYQQKLANISPRYPSGNSSPALFKNAAKDQSEIDVTQQPVGFK